MLVVTFRRLGLAVLATTLIAGCGAKSSEGGPSQVAVKVNSEEVTVHQLNGLLAKANIPQGADADAARKQALDRLVEESLLVQAAKERKIERDPRVVQAIEAARREVIARAYLEQIASTQAKPTEQAVHEYYVQHPELFSDRKIYSFRELAIADGEGREAFVKAHFEKGRSLEDLITALRTDNVRFSANAFVKPAEQLPLDAVSRLRTVKDGEVSITHRGNAVVVLQVAASKSEPVEEAKARGAIEQFLANKAKSESVAAEVKRLRDAAKVEYVGDFAKQATATPAPTAASSSPVAAPQATQSAIANDAEKIVKGM